MSNARQVPGLRVELAASRQLVILLSIGHLGALTVSTILAAATPALGLVCLALLISWGRALARHALLRSPRSVVALVLEGEQGCALRTRNGVWLHGRVTESSHVLPWLIVLHVAIDQQMFGARIVLMRDSVPHESHRRLRVRLRWIHYNALEIAGTDAPL